MCRLPSNRNRSGPVVFTRFPELAYRRQGSRLWRIIDRGTGAAVGPQYRSRAELLADLARYASVFGCTSTPSATPTPGESHVP